MKLEDISPEVLELKLKSAEHDFVERKSKSDRGGWLETAVAFANSAPIGYPAVLFVGADNDGNPHLERTELEDVTKSISDTLERPFPAIYRHVVPLHLTDGCCLAVIIPGSVARPHFAGQAFVRVGAETKRASDVQFENLIAQRDSKARKILEYKGKLVTLTVLSSDLWTVVDCNQFFVLLRSYGGEMRAYPLERLYISFDHSNGTLELVLKV
jgi:predicted HTH transcriptional regulator